MIELFNDAAKLTGEVTKATLSAAFILFAIPLIIPVAFYMESTRKNEKRQVLSNGMLDMNFDDHNKHQSDNNSLDK